MRDKLFDVLFFKDFVYQIKEGDLLYLRIDGEDNIVIVKSIDTSTYPEGHYEIFCYCSVRLIQGRYRYNKSIFVADYSQVLGLVSVK